MLQLSYWLIAARYAVYIAAQDPSINCAAGATPNTEEANLRKHLLCNYDSDYLPVGEIGPVVVEIALFTMGVKFNDQKSSLSYASIIQMIWTDHHLQWSPDDHRQTESIGVSSEHIWKPDLAMHNYDVNAGEWEVCSDSICDVNHKGEVRCDFRCELSSSCHGIYRWWPFDKQVCELFFGGWIYKYDEVHFVVKSYDYDRLEDTEDSEWRIIGDNTFTQIGGDTANSSAGTTTFRQRLELQRHSTLISVLTLTPAAVIAIIQLLTLWLAPDCAERLALICLNIFIQLDYMAFIAWHMPKNGIEMPLIVIICKISMGVSVILEVSTVIARGLLQIREQPPQWIINCCNNLGGRSFFEHVYILNAVPVRDEKLKGYISSNIQWTPIVRSLDRVLFAFIILIYVIFLIVVLVLSL